MIVFVGPGVGHLTDLVLPGAGGYLNLSTPDVDIFDCRLGRKRLVPSICFSLPRRLSGFHCFVFKFHFIERVVDQLNLLIYCGIKVNESKEKPSRFLQVQLISVWLIRYNQCKLTN